MRRSPRLASLVGGAVIFSLVLTAGPASVPGSSRSSVASTVGSRIDTPLAPVSSPRRNPLADGAGQSWLPLNDAMYKQAKAAADSGSLDQYAAGGGGNPNHPTPKPKPNASPTPSPTPTPTPTPSPVPSPTATPTPAPSPTPTPTPSPTPVASPTPTPTPTPDASPTPTPDASPTPTPDATPTPTPDATPTPTPTPTPSPSPTPTPTPSPTPNPSPTPSPSPSPTPTPTPSPGGGPTVGASWSGEYQGGLAPPDPTGAIGPSSYIQLINLRYGIFGRDGSLVNDGDLGALTGLPVSELSDPQIVWDPGAQRYYYGALDVNRYGFAFGYSMSANPASSNDFCKYILNYGYASTFSLPDYPKMAVTDDFVLFGANVFVFASYYNGSDLDWIHKPTTTSCPPSIAGGRFSALKNADGSLTSTPVPAINADPSGTGWVIGTGDPGTGSVSFLSVFKVTKDGSGNPVLSAATAIPVSAYAIPASARQQGTSATIDTLDSRIEQAVAGYDPRIGGTAIWAAHAVLGGAGSEERWYEVNTNPTPAMAQHGVVTSATTYVWNGSISPDRANDGASNAAYGSNAVMGFNTSSTTSYPALQMISKLGANPQSAPVLVHQSLGPNVDFSCGPICRWGDYSGARPDPVIASGGVVWLSGEWNVPATNNSATVWRTWNWSALP